MLIGPLLSVESEDWWLMMVDGRGRAGGQFVERVKWGELNWEVSRSS
jgi:hypothetical protein